MKIILIALLAAFTFAHGELKENWTYKGQVKFVRKHPNYYSKNPGYGWAGYWGGVNADRIDPRNYHGYGRYGRYGGYGRYDGYGGYGGYNGFGGYGALRGPQNGFQFYGTPHTSRYRGYHW